MPEKFDKNFYKAFGGEHAGRSEAQEKRREKEEKQYKEMEEQFGPELTELRRRMDEMEEEQSKKESAKEEAGKEGKEEKEKVLSEEELKKAKEEGKKYWEEVGFPPEEEPEKKEGEQKEGGQQKEKKEEIGKKVNELFSAKEKELQEKIEKSRTFEGEKLSAGRAHEEMLKFYLSELDYSIKYDFFHDKARVLDEKGKPILDKKTKKPIEFSTSFNPKGETPIIKFLKEELKNKMRKELGGEEEENKEEEKKEKEGFNFFELFKKAGEKMADFVKKGGKKLAVLGLTPAAVIEDIGRKVFNGPQKFFEKIKAGMDAGRAMEKEDKAELDKIFTSYKERIRELEEQKRKKSKIWELIKKLKI